MAHIYPVGIDLGTTNSAAAYLTQAGRTVMLRNELGDILTPSCVFFDDPLSDDRTSTIVGRDAKKALAFARDRVVTCAKRDLGETFTKDTVRGRRLPPEAIEAIVLKSLGDDIARELDDSRVVITVPAFFDERRRGLTVAAGEMASLNVLDIVNEPTAAALAFGEQLGYLASDGRPRAELSLMVYDLGGGTFDVTVLQLGQGKVRTIATDGDYTLGGIDWDRRLLEYVAQKFEDQYRLDFRDDPDATAKVLQACEAAKQTLSARQRAVIPVDFEDCHSEVAITRETFEQLTEDLVERTVVTARQTAEAAGMKWKSIDRVLLVGGSTRMPMVARRVIELVGRPPDEAVNPDEAVARGAAIYAAATMRARGIGETALSLRVIDVNSHSLGIAGVDQATQRLCNKILIPRNTPLPIRVTYKFVTKETDQQSVAIKVLEGESLDIDGCSLLGKAVLRDLPPDLPKGHPIEVILHCQQNGRLEVTAKVPRTDHAITVQFERERMMPAADVHQWRDAVGGGSAFDDLGPLLDKLEVEPFEVEPPTGLPADDSRADTAHGGLRRENRGERPPSLTAKTTQPVVTEAATTAPLPIKRPVAVPTPHRRTEISAVWVFVAAVVGALLLFLLIRLGLGG